MIKKDKNKSLKLRKNIVEIKQFIRRCYFNDITEQVIREYKDYIPFIFLVQKKHLSKDFIREFFTNNTLYDEYISSHQHLNQKFIEQWRDRIDWSWLCVNKNNFSQQFLLKWSEKIDWNQIWKKKKRWTKEFWNYLKKKTNH